MPRRSWGSGQSGLPGSGTGIWVQGENTPRRIDSLSVPGKGATLQSIRNCGLKDCKVAGYKDLAVLRS